MPYGQVPPKGKVWRKESPSLPEGALGLLVHVFYLSLVMFVDNLTTQFE